MKRSGRDALLKGNVEAELVDGHSGDVGWGLVSHVVGIPILRDRDLVGVGP